MDRIARTDLSNCDREQIHLVGSIQSQGYFLAFRLLDNTIYHASENISALLGRSAQELIGKSLTQFFKEEILSVILKSAKLAEQKIAQYLQFQEINKIRGPFEFYIYELEGLIAIEIELDSHSALHEAEQFNRSQRQSHIFIEELHSNESLLSLAQLTCRSIRSMIGFERVMMYKYLPSWDGEVIAEDKSAESHSFLGHRFPASDIPLPARELYLKNKSRLIVNSSDQAIPILPALHYLTRKAINLSHSKLRAVSPIHLEYLRNMGVASSFSVAIIVEGRLWGLIACHNRKVVRIPHELRLSCEVIAATFAIIANMKQQMSDQNHRFSFEEKMRELFRNLIASTSIVDTLLKNHTLLEEMFAATGIAIVSSGEANMAGLTPPESIVLELAAWFKEQFQREHKTVIATDNLASVESRFSDLKELACGALATFSPLNADMIFMLFRPEILKTITWGGDPRKIMDKRNYKGLINPRKSFESWNETVSLHSRPWEKFELAGAEFLRDFVFNNLIKNERLLDELGKRLNLT